MNRTRERIHAGLAAVRVLCVGNADLIDAVDRLERVVDEEIRRVESVAAAAAEANVRGVEMLVSLEDQSRELAAANVDAVLMLEQLEAQAQSEEARAEALAAANVDAVLLLDELEVQAQIDELTGLANKRLFRRRMEDEVGRAHRNGNPLAVVLLDVDHFKRVNDEHGHLSGDRVLSDLGRVLRGCVRPGDDLLPREAGEPLPARYGGEEFVILLPGAGPEEARAVAERLRRAVLAHAFRTSEEAPLPVSISAGVAALRVGDDAASLVARADAALYRAKREGRNRVSVEPASDHSGSTHAPTSAR